MSLPYNVYPLDSVAICRFFFTLRELTQQEETAALAGDGLPLGVGSNPPTVLFDYWEPGQEESTQLTVSSSNPIVADAVGAFHVALPVTLPGKWGYKGLGQDGSGNPLCATPRYFFVGQQ